ncbi:MAG: hypothetical protein NT027_14500 [Proteobacteria bacterium]|nr:hypothetical protein [Pseudomonadota bacterium]
MLLSFRNVVFSCLMLLTAVLAHSAVLMADEDQFLDEQAYVLLDSKRIQASGIGAYSDIATANRERAFSIELSAFEVRCMENAANAGWSHTVRAQRQPFTNLDRANRRWVSKDDGSLFCYGVTH